MKTHKHHWLSRCLAAICLAMAWRVDAGPEFTPNMVVETSAPGLARLEVMLISKEWREPRRFVFDGKESIVGGISLPKEYPAEYSITAFDTEGKATHTSKGSLPPYAALDKPRDIPLDAAENGEVLVVSLNRERFALDVRPSEESPGQLIARANIFDAAGNPLRFDPERLYWQLSDGRYIHLVPRKEPFEVDLVPDKGVEFAELCREPPVVTLCKWNTQCKPAKVCPTDPFVKISAGSNHTCALTQSGVAYCWGVNTDGQLGAPTTNSCLTNPAAPKCSARPIPVVCPAGSPCRFKDISSGMTLTTAVDINGDAWWWGRGLPDHHKVSAVLAGSTVTFSQAAAGFGHGCALSQSRSEIWCWGANGWGEAGVPTGNAVGGTWDVPDWAPVRVLVTMKFKRIVAGGEHTCGIGQTGFDVVCWGRDDLKQTSGPNSTILQVPGGIPFHFQKFGGLVSILDVATSPETTCVTLAFTTGVRCWGEDSWYNVTGFGMPELFTVGTDHMCALNNQQANCMGANNWGQVGVMAQAFQAAPVNVTAPPTAFTQLTAGSFHTCGITPDGDAFCWGINSYGQVGNGSTGSYPVRAPSKVARP